MSWIQHGARIGLLMLAVAGLLAWSSYHSEVSFADGLRYIRQAERIEHGAWSQGLIKSVDHPLHPMSIAAAHRVLGGHGPVSWQRAAQVASIGAIVLLVVPLYLVGLELYGATAAWLGCVLFLGSPIISFLVVNVLSETTFLLFWTWGLWGALRFLREGRFFWLPLTIAFAALAYLTRPEGLLLPLALVATLLILPLHWSTRIYWPRWWAAVTFLVLGPIALVGPYMAFKGGIGTKPSIARLIGTAPQSAPQALERERPLPPDQTTFETYKIATARMVKVIRTAVTMPFLPLVVLGLLATRPWTNWSRSWLFTMAILGASAAGLVRLHATGGYCTVRHGLVPAMLLILLGAGGLAWLMQSLVIPGRWLGRGDERFRLGPAVWGAALAALVGIPQVRGMTTEHGSFAVYRDAGAWIAQQTVDKPGKIVDLTGWSLFFSEQSGYPFSEVHWAAADPNTRWVVVREAHVHGRWHYTQYVRQMIDGREPIALIPPHPARGELQIRIYDRLAPKPAIVAEKPLPAEKDAAVQRARR